MHADRIELTHNGRSVVVDIEPSELRWAERRPGSLTWHVCPAVHGGQVIIALAEISKALRMETAPAGDVRRLATLLMLATGNVEVPDVCCFGPAEPDHAKPAA
jgi:hypothetical protein